MASGVNLLKGVIRLEGVNGGTNMNENRINITSVARQIRENGVGFLPHESHGLREPYVAQGGFLDVFSEVKPELYALAAIFTDEVVKKAYEERVNRQPFGLITQNTEKDLGYHATGYEDLQGVYPFIKIAMCMKYTLMSSVEKEIGEVEAGRASPRLDPIYQRLKELVDLLRYNCANETDIARYKDVASLIKSGVNTAAYVMGGLVGVIPHVDRNLNNSQRLVQIARNSYPLVAKLAMINIENTPSIEFLIPTLFGLPVPFKPKYFIIEGAGNNSRLAISENGIQELRKNGSSLENLGVGESPTVGCPAMVNFGDESSVKRLWDWHVEIAEKIYPYVDIHG